MRQFGWAALAVAFAAWAAPAEASTLMRAEFSGDFNDNGAAHTGWTATLVYEIGDVATGATGLGTPLFTAINPILRSFDAQVSGTDPYAFSFTDFTSFDVSRSNYSYQFSFTRDDFRADLGLVAGLDPEYVTPPGGDLSLTGGFSSSLQNYGFFSSNEVYLVPHIHSTVITNLGQFAVPEPSTWALLIVGLGAVGAALRRCREPVRA